MKLYCWLFGHKVKKAKVKDVIKETVEAIMRHEKAYGTISPEFIGRLLATALEEQRAEMMKKVVELNKKWGAVPNDFRHWHQELVESLNGKE